MDKCEYFTAGTYYYDNKIIDNVLNELGALGWECFAITDEYRGMLWWKRRLVSLHLKRKMFR